MLAGSAQRKSSSASSSGCRAAAAVKVSPSCSAGALARAAAEMAPSPGDRRERASSQGPYGGGTPRSSHRPTATRKPPVCAEAASARSGAKNELFPGSY